MTIITRPPWKQQPQWAAPLRPRYAQRCALLFAPQFGFRRDIYTGTPLTLTNTPFVMSSPMGLALSVATNNGITATLPQSFEPPYLLIAHAQINQTGLTHNLISLANVSRSNNYNQLAINSSQQVRTNTRDGSEGAIVSATVGTVTQNLPFIAAGEHRSNAHRRPWLNGYAGTEETTNFVVNGNRVGIGHLARLEANADFMNGRIAWAAILRGLFSESEISLLTSDPWQLFAPRQIIVPYSAAAPAIPTLSAPTFVPGSLSATGWRGRVTAT